MADAPEGRVRGRQVATFADGGGGKPAVANGAAAANAAVLPPTGAGAPSRPTGRSFSESVAAADAAAAAAAAAPPSSDLLNPGGTTHRSGGGGGTGRGGAGLRAQAGGGDGAAARSDLYSIHGEQAAKRRAVAELIFFAGVNDLRRCREMVATWAIDPRASYCQDYDRRTPLHVAAAEGAYSVVAWLVGECGVDVNPRDRFDRTPLEEAVRMDHSEVARLLASRGGAIVEDGAMVPLERSKLRDLVDARSGAMQEIGWDPEWEVNPKELRLVERIGGGEFGEVYKARWHGSYVAAKVLKRSDEIALGDFRTEIAILRKIHHPNCVQFLGACTKQRPYVVITELMACSLADSFVKTYFAPTQRRQVEVALDFARGMAYLHSRRQPIVHRDLKPANLMISGNLHADAESLYLDSGVVKVADFGLSKSLVPVDRHMAGGGAAGGGKGGSVGGSVAGASGAAAAVAAAAAAAATGSSGGGAATGDAGAPASTAPGNSTLDLMDGGGALAAAQAAQAAAQASAADLGGQRPPAASGNRSQMLSQVYKLTGETGSYRYMAPEVFRHEPYSLRVDVYSFAMIVFQLFETSVPFHGHDPVDAARQAAMLGARPAFPPRRSLTPMTEALRQLVSDCWHPDADSRPTFEDIVGRLEDLLRRLPPHSAFVKRGAGPQAVSGGIGGGGVGGGGAGGNAGGAGAGGACCSVQ